MIMKAVAAMQQPLMDIQGQQPGSSIHIVLVVLPKSIQHHVFFAGNPVEIHRQKANQPTQPGYPVLEQ